jgi:hypothetical protein
VSSELSEGCRDDLRKLARRWRQLVRNDPTAMLGPAGKALSPPELLLWLQAYGHAAPTVPAEGDSGTDPPTHAPAHPHPHPRIDEFLYMYGQLYETATHHPCCHRPVDDFD